MNLFASYKACNILQELCVALYIAYGEQLLGRYNVQICLSHLGVSTGEFRKNGMNDERDKNIKRIKLMQK